MKRKHGIIYVQSPKYPKLHALLGFFWFIVLSVTAGALVASTFIPFIYVVDQAEDKVYTFYDGLPEEIELDSLMEKSNIYALNGAGEPVLLASFYDQNREVLTWEEVPDFVKDAAIAAEDPRFYEHGGVDIQGIARAFIINQVEGDDVQGGSSITQQLVKNTLVQRAEAIADPLEREEAYEIATETTLNRKLREMKLAIGLEKKYTKDEILLGYLNIVGFGERIYGIQAAAKYYYGVPANELTLNQAATLIAIANSPNYYRINQPENPRNGIENGYALTLNRRNYVLDAMLEHGFITRVLHDEARNQPIEPNITEPSTGCAAAGNAAYFCDYVRKVIENDPVFGTTPEERRNLLTRGGLEIYTTLDLGLQNVTQDAINAYVPSVIPGTDIGSASVSIQPGTGHILAMAQNKNFTEDPEVAATGANYTAINYNADLKLGGSTGFQPGSTYKLFTLVAWLESGRSLSDGLYGPSRFRHFPNSCEGDWNGNQTFRNDDGSYGAWATPLRATTSSINTVYLAMAQELDLCTVRDTAIKMGVHRADGTTLQSNPTSVIGTNEIAPLQMANAYATIASGGVYCEPIAITQIFNSQGEELTVPQANCERVISEGVAGATAYALERVIRYGTGSASRLGDGIPVLGKTGTTDEALHTWMIGSSTNVSTAVWVGNVTGYTNMRSTSINGINASQIRHRIFPAIMSYSNGKYGGGAFTPADPNLVW